MTEYTNQYTPTTDEVRDRYFAGSGRLLPSLGEFYRWLSAHNAEVPEPSAEEWAAQVREEQGRASSKGYTAEHDAEHGIRHLLNWAIDYSRQGKAKASSGLILSALDLLDAMAPESDLSFDPDALRLVTELRGLRAASAITPGSSDAHDRDNEPCETCGGDRLRTDFTGSGRCHASRPGENREEQNQ